jgi:drug/metabolite transporter (DMT)-like permease
MPSPNPRSTLLGIGAVLLWALLAAITLYAGKIPPFQLTAMSFTVGTLVGVIYMRATGQSLGALRTVPFGAHVLGVYGLLGFHTCYFFALQNAPPLEVSLIIYLWPLLIVLFSGLLPGPAGGGLRWWHVGGTAIGFAGTALILLGGAEAGNQAGANQVGPNFAGAAFGVVMAFLAAFIWSSYSVASRLYAGVPSTAVVAACAATAVGAALLHLVFETTVTPAGPIAWAAILALGVGPVGLAFYIWDEGVKHGDIRLLGVASYATPLISTVLLAALGLGEASTSLWLAAVLIAGGALLASADKFKRP